MVGVAENYLCTQRMEIVGIQRLDSRRRTDRHEYRCPHTPMRGSKLGGSRSAGFGLPLELKRICHSAGI
jgi:hypothetical protein